MAAGRWQELAVIDCWRPYSQQPVLAGDLVLLAGSGPGGRLPVLEAIDRHSHRSLWRCEWEDETDEIEGGLPAPDDQGLIWQGLYARESRFVLQAVDRHGQRQGLWILDEAEAAGYPIHASDLTSKLIVAPAFADSEHVLTGWIYRHREARCYLWNRRSESALRLEGWPHALTAESLLLASSERQAWECRRPENGELRWSLPLARWECMGQAEGGWLFSQRDEHLGEREDTEQAYRAGMLSQQDYIQLLNRLHSPPGLELRAPVDGVCLQRWELPGECLDARWGQSAPVAVCRVGPETMIYDAASGQSQPLTEDDPAWLPPQSFATDCLVQMPKRVFSIPDTRCATLDLPLTTRSQARIERVAYRAHTLTQAQDALWLRDGERLWRLPAGSD